MYTTNVSKFNNNLLLISACNTLFITHQDDLEEGLLVRVELNIYFSFAFDFFDVGLPPLLPGPFIV